MYESGLGFVDAAVFINVSAQSPGLVVVSFIIVDEHNKFSVVIISEV